MMRRHRRVGGFAAAAALLGVAAATARAQSPVLLTFDGAAPGSPANLAAAGTGLQFAPASFDFETVSDPAAPDFGDSIPGTERWRVDSASPPLTVADSGGDKVLDSLLQPTLLLFDPALTGQQILLPAGTLYDDIRVSFRPGGGIDTFSFTVQSFQNFGPLDLLFYRGGGSTDPVFGSMTLSAANVGRTLQVNVGALADVPEPGAGALSVAGLPLLLRIARRRRRA